MCGLAGLAFHPGATIPGPLLTTLMDRLLVAMAHRGRHATGLAIGGNEAAVTPLIRKLALPAEQFIQSEAYRTAVDLGLALRSPIWLGHTRYATHQNAREDAAAHPFREGNVVGAHNGIIYNWDRLLQEERPDPAWTVDSQAAFALLSRYPNPNTALDKLEGYWALTWLKRGRLYACRTEDAALVFGYLPRLRLLVWASTDGALREAVRLAVPEADRAGFHTQVAQANTLYEFDPDEFTTGPNPALTELTFAGRGRGRVKYDTSLTDGSGGRGRTVRPHQAPMSTGTQLEFPVTVHRSGPYTGPASRVDPALGQGAPRKPGKRRPAIVETPVEGVQAMTPAGQFELLWQVVRALQLRTGELEALVADQDRELSLLKRQVLSLGDAQGVPF